MNDKETPPEFNRRDFLKQTSLATIMTMLGGVELRAQDASSTVTNNLAETKLTAIPPPPIVNYGIIGLGTWGREIVQTLAQVRSSPVVALCDRFPKSLARASDLAPTAMKFDHYKALLADKDVQAVVIATPTQTHREIVEAALASGKHVYCEAPLANTVEDAKAIAKAAKQSPKLFFQSGLQERSHPQRPFLLGFLRAGAMGTTLMTRAHWHKKTSWRIPSSDAGHEKELNWRLDPAISPGLAGEIGMHQFDSVSWFLGARPTAVTGFGSVLAWKDGRTVADTIQAIFDFPGGVELVYDATLGNSFESAEELFYGTDAAVMVRDHKAWMFKEADAPLLGWEVYARKDMFYTESGVALVADATKQSAITKNAETADAYPYTPLYYALEAFTVNAGIVRGAVEDFVTNFGDSDLKALADQLVGLKLKPAATWKDGFEATVLGLKANEAVIRRQKIALTDDLFSL